MFLWHQQDRVEPCQVLQDQPRQMEISTKKGVKKSYQQKMRIWMDQMDGSPGQEHEGELTRLLRNLRNVISDNLASNQYEGGVEVQAALLAVLDAIEQRAGLTVELATVVQNCFQRLYRKAKNRGDETMAIPQLRGRFSVATAVKSFNINFADGHSANSWRTVFQSWWDTGKSHKPGVWVCMKKNPRGKIQISTGLSWN